MTKTLINWAQTVKTQYFLKNIHSVDDLLSLSLKTLNKRTKIISLQ